MLRRHFLPPVLVDGHIMERKVAVPRLFGPAEGGGITFERIINGSPLDTLELEIEGIASEVNSGALFVCVEIGKVLRMVRNLFGSVPGCKAVGEEG